MCEELASERRSLTEGLRKIVNVSALEQMERVSQWLEGSETRDTFELLKNGGLQQTTTAALGKQYQQQALTANGNEIGNLTKQELDKTRSLVEEIKKRW